MKLNPDCVRDILIAIESSTDGIFPFEYTKGENTHPTLTKYDHSEIQYHMQQCHMANLIIGYQSFDMGDYIQISDLAPAGHEFIANIRKDTIWNKTKQLAASVGSSSLEALAQIASSVVTELITNHFCS